MEPVVIFTTEEVEEGLIGTAAIAPLPINTLPFLQSYVGGAVDCVQGNTPAGQVDVWCADEVAPGTPINILATVVAERPIRGTAVITQVDDEGNTVGLNADNLNALMVLGEAVEKAMDARLMDSLAALLTADDNESGVRHLGAKLADEAEQFLANLTDGED